MDWDQTVALFIGLIVQIALSIGYYEMFMIKRDVETKRFNQIAKDFDYIEEQYIKVMNYANEQPLKDLTIRQMIDKIREVKVRVKIDTRKKEGITYKGASYNPPKF
jgi:hypothetical protein